MRRETLLAWLLLLICFKALSNYACESALTPQRKSLNIRAKQFRNAYESMVEPKRKLGDGRDVEGLNDVKKKSVQVERAGKGVYGGGDMLRPRTKSRNGATSLLLKPSTLLSAAIIHVLYNLG